MDTGEISNMIDDQTGTHTLRALVALIQPALGRLPNLPPDCEPRIWWSAYSDSLQAGFVLPADLAASLGKLGVDVYGTVYLDDPDGPESETPSP